MQSQEKNENEDTEKRSGTKEAGEQEEELFFELASESRLAILRELERKNLKMQEVARSQGVTATEATRQLQRLTEASLLQRQSDGSYWVTQYGKLVLHFSSKLGFLSKEKSYFLAHDIAKLPPQFLNRIDDLARAELRMDMMENINTAERIAKEAEKYLWGGGAEQPLSIGPIIEEKIPKGVTFKFLFPQKFIPAKSVSPEIARAVEWRSIDDIPVNMAFNEKEAGITFNLLSGRADYAGFIGKDPVFTIWVKDLFLHFWEMGKRAGETHEQYLY